MSLKNIKSLKVGKYTVKKIKLKKQTEGRVKRIGYKIDYNGELNAAQYEAVMHTGGAALVIAGAGTGKTRTLIYRLARLVEDGVPPEAILLLTFTRKAAAEMTRRGSLLLDGRCERVSGGTFHSFALMTLRQKADVLGYENMFNVIDQADSHDTINLLRSRLKFDKKKSRFPRKESLHRMFNLSVNRCQSIEDVLETDFPFFLEEFDKIKTLQNHYEKYKKQHSLMDYDDLLVNLLTLLQNHENIRKELNKKYRFVLVDEYQDTNRLQHEIVLLLGGDNQNIMAVGDDAQSIYSFRGADFQNIMSFPDSFEKCKIFKIEENYRSTQPILDMTNKIIEAAAYKYEKELFTRKIGSDKPMIISAEDEQQQSLFAVQQILELREEGIPLEDTAVLFRSGFLSFNLEIELGKANIPYRKFGGMKFMETAHIKDVLSYFKIMYNESDAISWNRALLLLDGIGPATSNRIIDAVTQKKLSLGIDPNAALIPKNREGVTELFRLLGSMKKDKLTIGRQAEMLVEYYKPMLKKKHDDWQKRHKDLEMFIEIAERYRSMNDFLNDMAIEPPVESVEDLEPESKEEEFLTISTIHSAKGLEWKAVFIIWALDGRFPSSKAADSIETLEEERRLFYVACTRAKEKLYITYPTNIFDRQEGIVLSKPSRFLDNIGEDTADRYMLEGFEAGEN